MLNGVETLILGGEQDLMTPADHSREIAEQVPGAELVILPEAGHMVMLEHHDVVTDHLRDLVERALRHRGDRGVTTDAVPAARRRAPQPAGTTWSTAVRGCVACPELVGQPYDGWWPGSAPPRRRRAAGRRGARARRRTTPACRSSAAPASCSTRCSPRPGSPRRGSRSPTCSSAGRRPTASRAGPRWRAAGRGWSGRSSWPTRAVVVALGGTAAEWFFGPGARIAALREQGRAPLRTAAAGCVVTYHPSAAIRFGPSGAPLAALRDDLADGRPRWSRVTGAGADDCRADRRAADRRRHAPRSAGGSPACCGPATSCCSPATLGAGKTTLTQGIGDGLGVRGPVTSPTFVIARVHPSLATARRWCTSTPTGSAASPRSTTSTSTRRWTSR